MITGLLRVRRPFTLLLSFALTIAITSVSQAASLVIATVDNGHMQRMQALSNEFEETHPDINILWVRLTEPQLRTFVSSDVTTQTGLFDVVTVGMLEVPVWAERGWLKPFKPGATYAPEDLLVNIREGLSYRGQLYAAPIYGESSMLMYRRDLMQQAELTMPAAPTWQHVAAFAEKLHDPDNGVYGICLRGTPGWGENVTLVTTMANAFGGQWFDMEWEPKLTTPPWQQALSLYVDLLTRYGPADAVERGYNQNLALFQEGRCAIWVDATVAGGFVSDPATSKPAGAVGFAPAPTAVTEKGSHWLWAWALAIPSSVDAEREQAAQLFVNWATSRGYIRLAASRFGWGQAPAGTRQSTYATPEFISEAPWAEVELAAIGTADPTDATLPSSPYIGVQFAVIPEFRTIGDRVGGYIADALTGKLSVEEALEKAQYATKRRMDASRFPGW